MFFGYLRSGKVDTSSAESDLARFVNSVTDSLTASSATPPLPPMTYPKKPPIEAAFGAGSPKEITALNSAELPAQEPPTTRQALPLVWPEVRPLLTPTLYLALQQYQPMTYDGFVGVECIHCTRNMCHIFFSETNMTDRMWGLVSHLRSCSCCPQGIRDGIQTSEEELELNEAVAFAFRMIWCRLRQHAMECKRKVILPLDKSHLADIAAYMGTRVYALESAVEASNDDNLNGLRMDWEHDSCETNMFTDPWNRCFHDVTESGSDAFGMATQDEMDAAAQHRRTGVLQDKKPSSMYVSKDIEQTEFTLRDSTNDTLCECHCQQTQKCTAVDERCVKKQQENARKMEELREEALPVTSFANITTMSPYRKISGSNKVTLSSSAVHRLEDTSSLEYSHEEDTLAHCHQINGDSAASRDSFSLSDFYVAQYGDLYFPPTSDSNFTFMNASDSNSSITCDVPMGESSIKNDGIKSIDFVTQKLHQNLCVPSFKPTPRTVIDFAFAAKNKSSHSVTMKSLHMSCKPQSPLDLLSTVCNTPSVKFSSIMCRKNASTATSKSHLFDKEDGNVKVYPLNNINEHEQKAFMLTYRDFPPIMSLSETAGTDLLVHAADTVEYSSHRAMRKRNASLKRKHLETSQSSPQPISLEELGISIKKSKIVTKNTVVDTVPQSDVKPSSDARLQCAFLLANQALQNATTLKQLLLSMAIGRGALNGRGPSVTTYQPSGTVLSKSFLWSMYPSLEAILRENMKEYYEMSTNRCMTKAQLDFNNKLVKLINEEVASRGWAWGEGFGNEKQIRNRIRCYYKSHIQNAKKRLMTMLRNPKKPSHVEALAEHFHIIKGTGNRYDDSRTVPDLKSCCVLSTTNTSSSVDECCGDMSGSHTEVSCQSNSSFENSFDGLVLQEESNIQ